MSSVICSLDAFIRGLPAAAAHIGPHLEAVAQSAGAHTSITPTPAQACLQVLPLQMAYVHASVLGRKLQVIGPRNLNQATSGPPCNPRSIVHPTRGPAPASRMHNKVIHHIGLPGVSQCGYAVSQEVLGSVLQPSAEPAAATAADQQAVARCAWALYLAAKSRQQPPGGATPAASFHMLLGAVAATAAALPAAWLLAGGADVGALAAQHGAPAAEVEASTEQAGYLLAEATAAAAPLPAHNTLRAAVAGAQPPKAAVIAWAPGSAATLLSAAAAWLEGQYAERCLGSGASGDGWAPGDDFSGSLGIDERGFAGWVPWRPAQQRAAATAAGEASPHPGWPSGCVGSVAERLFPAAGCGSLHAVI